MITGQDPALIDVDALRATEEGRLAHALAAWKDAARQLETAIALVETREREFEQVAAEVHAAIHALDLVAAMSRNQPLSEASQAPATAAKTTSVVSRSVVTRSVRSLFSPQRISALSPRSVLP